MVQAILHTAVLFATAHSTVYGHLMGTMASLPVLRQKRVRERREALKPEWIWIFLLLFYPFATVMATTLLLDMQLAKLVMALYIPSPAKTRNHAEIK